MSTVVNGEFVTVTGVEDETVAEGSANQPFSTYTVTTSMAGDPLDVDVTWSSASLGVLTLSETASSTGADIAEPTSQELEVAGTPDQINEVLQGLTFTAGEDTGVETFQISVTEELYNDVASTTSTVTVAGSGPTIAAPGSTTVAVGQAGSAFSGLSVTPNDGATTETVTISLKDDTNAKLDMSGLSATDDAVLSSGVGDYSLTFVGSTAAVNAALQDLKVDGVVAGTTSISISATDANGGTSISNTSLTVSAAAPIITGAGTVSIGTMTTGYPFDALSVAPQDGASTVTLTLSLESAEAAEFSTSDLTDAQAALLASGSNDQTLTFVGTTADVNGAIENLGIVGGMAGSTTLDITASDSNGGTASISEAIDVTLPALSIAGAADQQAKIDQTATPLAGVSITANDGAKAVTVSVQMTDPTSAVFDISKINSADVQSDQDGQVVLSGDVSSINQDLAQLGFYGEGTSNEGLTISVSDDLGATASASEVVSVTPTPPVIIGAATASIPATEEGELLQGVTVSPQEGWDESTLILQIGNANIASFDTRLIDAADETAVITATNSKVIVAGTVEQVDDVLRSLLVDGVSPGTTTVGITVTDALGVSSAQTETITITSIPPNFVGMDQVSVTVGSEVMVEPDLTFDIESGAPTITVQLTISDTAIASFDTAALVVGGVVSSAAADKVVFSGSIADVTAAVDALTVIGGDTTGSAYIALSVSDSDGGTNGVTYSINNDYENPTVTGVSATQTVRQGSITSLFPDIGAMTYDDSSAVTATVQLSAPSLGNLVAGGDFIVSNGTVTETGSLSSVLHDLGKVLFQAGPIAGEETISVTLSTSAGTSTTVVEDVAITGLPPVLNVVASVMTDDLTTSHPFEGASVGTSGASVSLTVIPSDLSLGAFDTVGIALDGSTMTTNNDGSLTFQGSASQVSADLQSLAFAPVSSGSETFTLSAVTADGATSSATETLTIVAADPVVSPLPTGTMTATVGDTVSPYGDVSVSAPDGSLVTATVYASTAGLGAFDISGLTGDVKVSTDASGALSLTGAAADVTTDLQELTYTGTTSGAESFSLQVTTADGGTASASDSYLFEGAIPIIGGLDTSTGAASAGTEIQPFDGLSIAVPDGAASVSVTVSLADGSLGTLDTSMLHSAANTVVRNADGSFTITGTALGDANALHEVTFEDSGSGVETFNVSVTTSNGGTASASESVAFAALPVLTQSNTTTNVGSSDIKPFANDVLTVADNPATMTATVSLSDPSLAVFDTSALAIPSEASVDSNGALVITGSVSDVQNDLQTLSLATSAIGVETLDVALTTSNGGTSTSASTVTILEQAAGLGGLDTAAPVTAVGTFVKLFPDAVVTGPDTITVTLSRSDSSVVVLGTEGDSGPAQVTVDGDGDLTITGSATDVTTALQSVTAYGLTSGTDTIKLDFVNAGGGGYTSEVVTVGVAPAISGVDAITTTTLGDAVQDFTVIGLSAGTGNVTATVSLSDTSLGYLTEPGSSDAIEAVTFKGTVADVQARLQSLGFMGTTAGTEVLTVDVVDGNGLEMSATSTVTITVPTVAIEGGTALSGTSVTVGQIAMPFPDTKIEIGGGADAVTARVGLSSQDTGAFNTGSLQSGADVSIDAAGTLTITGTGIQVSEDLQSLSFVAADAGSQTISLAVTSESGASESTSETINIVDTMPAIAGLRDTTLVDGVNDTPFTNAVVSGTGTLTVTVTALDSSVGALDLTKITGGATVTTNADGSVSFVGSATDVTTALEGLGISGTGFGTEDVGIKVASGGGSTSSGEFVTILAPPTLVGLSDVTVLAGDAVALSTATLATVNSAQVDVTVTLSDTRLGYLSVGLPADPSEILVADGKSVELKGSLADIQAELDSVTFNTSAAGSETLTVTATDENGLATTASSTLTIVAPATPDLSGAFALDGTSSLETAVISPFADVQLNIADDPATVIAQVGLGNAAVGSLDLSGLASAASVFADPTGGLVITGSEADVQADLQALRFQASAPGAETFTLSLTTSTGGTASGAETVSFVDQMPTLTGDNRETVLSGSAAHPFADAVVAGTGTITATMSALDGSVGSYDFSGIVNGVSIVAGANGSVSVTGDAEDVTSALQAVVVETKGVGTANLTLTVSNTAGETAEDFTLVSTTAPILSGVGDGQTEVGQSVVDLGSVVVGTADPGHLEATVELSDSSLGKLVTGADVQPDTLLYADGTTVSFGGTVSEVQADLRSLGLLATAAGIETVTVTLEDANAFSTSATSAVTILDPAVPTLSGATALDGMQASDAVALKPFAATELAVADDPATVTATVSVSAPALGSFDLSGLSSAALVSTDAQGDIVITGSASSVSQDLQALNFTAQSGGTQSFKLDVTTSNGTDASASETVSFAASTPELTLSGAPVTTATVGSELFPAVDIVLSAADNPASVTATLALSDTALAAFDVSQVADPAEVTVNSDGSVAITGSLADVQADLRTLGIDPTAAGTESVSLALTTSTGGEKSVTSPAVTIVDAVADNHYAPDDSGNYDVFDEPGQTAIISYTDSAPTIVFGGTANLDFTGGNATIVLNGSNQTGAVSVHSTGGNQVWTGTSTVDYTAGGHSQLVMGATAGQSGSVNITAGTTADTDEVDVWGSAGTTQTVTTDGQSNATVYGGASDLQFTGKNATVVLNGDAQTGAATLTSGGGNTVWAGDANLSFTEGTGSDDIYLTGDGQVTVFAGASSAGSTTVSDLNVGKGSIILIGGEKAQSLSIGDSNATVFGGMGGQTITQSGSGSLVVADAAATGGQQTITVSDTATGLFQYWGGGNSADITLGEADAFISAGSGNVTLTGGSGSLALDLSADSNVALNVDGSKSGNIDVFGYKPSEVTLNIADVTSQAVAGGSLVMLLNDGASVTFHNYVPSTSV